LKENGALLSTAPFFKKIRNNFSIENIYEKEDERRVTGAMPLETYILHQTHKPLDGDCIKIYDLITRSRTFF
jgi:hypothetical protein